MEDAYNLCNVIEIFCWKNVNKIEEGFLVLSNFKWHWHNCVKTHPPGYVDIQIPPSLQGKLIYEMLIMIVLFFDLSHIESNKSLGDTKSKK